MLMRVSFLKNGILIYKKSYLMSINHDNRIEELKKIIKPYIQNQEEIETLTEETDFIKDLQINSANLVDIVLDIEEKYEIVIDNPSMERMLNVKVALEIIEEKLKE
jgi:acyl carrier protein